MGPLLDLSKCVLSADKAQTGERSRNVDGTLSGADRSTASDAEFWSKDDVYRCCCTQLHVYTTKRGLVHLAADIVVVQAYGL